MSLLSSHNKFCQNATSNNFLVWNHGHVVILRQCCRVPNLCVQIFVDNHQMFRFENKQNHKNLVFTIRFLTGQAESLQLPWKVTECVAGKPIFVMTWEGTDPALPSVVLNSHTGTGVPYLPDPVPCQYQYLLLLGIRIPLPHVIFLVPVPDYL